VDSSRFLQLDPDIFDHHKVLRVAAALHEEPDLVALSFIATLAYCRRLAPDGDLSELGIDGLCLKLRWHGVCAARTVLEAMVDVGFLALEPLRVKNFLDQHRRLLAAQRAKRVRERKRDESVTPRDESEPESVTPRDAALLVRDECVTEREREREREKEKEQGQKHCAIESDDSLAAFDLFWSHYPRKLQKQAALRAWRARLNDQRPPDDMVQAARHYAEHCAAAHTEPRFIKHASTFIGPDVPYLDWVEGEPEEAVVAPRSGRAVDSAFGAIGALYRELNEEAP